MQNERAERLIASTGEVPRTLAAALDPQWLTRALAFHTGGASITAVQTVEVIRTVATKVRFTATFDGRTEAFCLKAFLDMDMGAAGAGIASVREADFYTELASRLCVRVPTCVATVVDREAKQGVVIMRDLIHDGARFCTALETFTVEQAASSLEQLARLHSNRAAFEAIPWLRHQIHDFARGEYAPLPLLQQMLNGERGEGLTLRTRDAGVLLAGLRALAEYDASCPQVLVHGDCHAGNIFQTADGPGLIDWQIVQRGGWALDVAYHICAVLDVALAEREERMLLQHYLATMRSLGAETPSPEQAWEQYRKSLVYGYYLWAITRRVEPAIINVFVNRLGRAVARHDSFTLLGV